MSEQTFAKNSSKLIYAISGCGKSSLSALEPKIIDGDKFLYSTLESYMPELNSRLRVRRWKQICRIQKPNPEQEKMMVEIRAHYVEQFCDALSIPNSIIVTSIFDLPFSYDLYIGYEIGQYIPHLLGTERIIDNDQSEEDNLNLENFTPLLRLEKDTFLNLEHF